MKNQYWIEQEKIFNDATENVVIPNSKLERVDSVEIKTKNDINLIPEGGGCYWIWTNEPVIHTLHKHELPKKLKSGEIIYNGIAKDNVKDRISHHLLASEEAGWSGISLDIYNGNSKSHRKKAMSSSGKVPYVFENKILLRGNKKKNLKKGDEIKVHSPIRTKKQLLTINLSDDERNYINSTNHSKYYFRNGINILNDKHSNYSFKVYFITGLKSLYLDFIEKKWRENGLPRLCSYLTGR